MTKINTSFEDISASEAEKLTLAKFREIHDKDDPRETFKLIFFLSLSLILSITGVCVILLNVDFFDGFPSWFNSLTWVENLFWELPVLALGLWWVIKRSGK